MLVPAGTSLEVPENSSHSVHKAGRTDTCSNMTKVSGTEEEDGLYGPWMVVSRKRNGHKGTKKRYQSHTDTEIWLKDNTCSLL